MKKDGADCSAVLIMAKLLALKNLDVVILISVLMCSILLVQKSEYQCQFQKEASKLNITHKFNASILLFNRTPKAASETFMNLLSSLAKTNKFNAYKQSFIKKSENCFMHRQEDRQEYVNMLQNSQNVTAPLSYSKHMNFLNFEQFNLTNPIYVNFVRDPIERVISWYYYIRQGWYQIDPRQEDNFRNSKFSNNIKTLKMTFGDCVKSKEAECLYILGSSIHYGLTGGSHFSQVN